MAVKLLKAAAEVTPGRQRLFDFSETGHSRSAKYREARMTRVADKATFDVAN